MPRLLVVEQDAARRDALRYVLSAAGYEVTVSNHENSLSQATKADLLIVGDSDLGLLDELPRKEDRYLIPILALINPGNCVGILRCLAANVDSVFSRQRTSEEILSKVAALLDQRSSSPLLSHDPSSDFEIPVFHGEYRNSDLIAALQAACEDIGLLQEQYEVELSHRRKVEQALMESEAFYQSLVETLPLAMLRKDLSGRFTFANRLLCEAFRRPVEEIIGHSDHDFFPRELADKYRSDDRRVLEQRCNFETTEEFQAPSGERRYTHVVKSPVYDSAGNLVGIQGIFSDVTEKERAERELVQTKARLQQVLDAATQVAIVSMDVDGRINLFNTGAERMLGYTMFEMLGKSIDFFHLPFEVQTRSDELSKQFGYPILGFDIFAEYARRGERDEREWTYVRKDGSQVRVMVSMTSKRDNDGMVNGFLAIALDITARHRAEAESLKAKNAAEAANRAKSDFLANMSHEIRTPLNAIIGMTELVRDTELNTSQREYLGMVQESGESLLAVINDILDFSKIEAGKLSLESVGFNLRELLGDTMKSLALRAHRKKLELACDVEPIVPTAVNGDPHRLRQIVVNLVGNAIKFTESGEVILDVDVEESMDREITLHFRVTDTGIGISSDQLETIFEAFEQADTSTTRRYGGTGLGLAISSRLVELMQGRIWVESRVGEGSTFHFLVKFATADDSELIAASTIYPPMLAGLRVLIVDDNATNRRILSEILTSWKMQPAAVASVQDAFGELRRKADLANPYALVLTDAKMPDIDGFELARQIHANPVLCRAMVMMLTSADRPGDLKRCDELGVSAYLIKPIKQSELLEAILVAVGGQSSLAGSLDKSPVAARTTTRARNVLLAEDSLINQKLAIGLLEKWGHVVTVANNGHEAVRLSGQREFDLVLMDVQMPELDGLDATRAIRVREQVTGIHLPILAMTAHAMKGDRELCLEAGMDDYLMKPIHAEHLFNAIERIGNATSDPAGNGSSRVDGKSVECDRVDWGLAQQAVNQDLELLKQVVEAFAEECPQLLETMRQTSQVPDFKRFQRAAHTLKSGLRMFGIETLAERVEKLELDAKSAKVPSPDDGTIDDVVRRSQCVLSEMATYLQSSAVGSTD